jgi:nitroreductase
MTTHNAIGDDVTGQRQGLLDLLSSRWSCRAFRPDPVPRETIRGILDLARLTPSWCNTQPWHAHVISGAALVGFRRALLSETANGPREHGDLPFPAGYHGVYQQRRRECGWQLYDSVGIERGDRAASAREMMRNFSLFDAPHVAVITTEGDLGVYGAVDCGLFVQTFLLAAQEAGLAAIPQAALAQRSAAIRQFLDLPPNRLVLVGISFGYPDLRHPVNGYRTSRQSVDEVASFLD